MCGRSAAYAADIAGVPTTIGAAAGIAVGVAAGGATLAFGVMLDGVTGPSGPCAGNVSWAIIGKSTPQPRSPPAPRKALPNSPGGPESCRDTWLTLQISPGPRPRSS